MRIFSTLLKTLPILAALALSIGCSKHADVSQMEPDAAYRYLERRYNEGDYLAAVDGLDFFTLNYSGHALVDSAQFLLGLSHFHQKEYLLAAEAFNELVRRFPRSPLVAEAMFQAGYSYWELSPKYSLDQEYTHKAIDAFQGFIDYFPERSSRVRDAQEYIAKCRSKLAQKEFASGIIYIKMKDWLAAEIYLKSVIELYYDTEWAAEAAFWVGIAQAGDGRSTEAAASWQSFISKYPDHHLVDKAKANLRKISTSLGSEGG